jgi:hypothetical protein
MSDGASNHNNPLVSYALLGLTFSSARPSPMIAATILSIRSVLFFVAWRCFPFPIAIHTSIPLPE